MVPYIYGLALSVEKVFSDENFNEVKVPQFRAYVWWVDNKFEGKNCVTIAQSEDLSNAVVTALVTVAITYPRQSIGILCDENTEGAMHIGENWVLYPDNKSLFRTLRKLYERML